MENEIFKELWNSKCERDSKSRHFWEKLGVVNSSEPELIWRCSQCQMCLDEPLSFLELKDDAFHRSEKDKVENRIIDHFMKKNKDPSKLTRRKLYTILFQTYYLAQLETKQKGG